MKKMGVIPHLEGRFSMAFYYENELKAMSFWFKTEEIHVVIQGSEFELLDKSINFHVTTPVVFDYEVQELFRKRFYSEDPRNVCDILGEMFVKWAIIKYFDNCKLTETWCKWTAAEHNGDNFVDGLGVIYGLNFVEKFKVIDLEEECDESAQEIPSKFLREPMLQREFDFGA